MIDANWLSLKFESLHVIEEGVIICCNSMTGSLTLSQSNIGRGDVVIVERKV